MDKKFKDHVIICGLGATALQIIEELESYLEKAVGKDTMIGEVNFRDYLVIDSSSQAIERIRTKSEKMHYLVGDATDDDVLERAYIRDAYGIFPILSSEKDNLYITMAARQLNPGIRIVARTADVFNIGKKLFKAGANSVVSPNFIGGMRLASEIARPHVTDFLDEMLRDKDMQLEMTEVTVSKYSALCGLSLKEARLPEKCGLMIIAMRKRNEPFYTYNPSATARLEYADKIIVLGQRRQIVDLRMQVGPV